jgi:hypothetical protein
LPMVAPGGEVDVEAPAARTSLNNAGHLLVSPMPARESAD